MPVLLRLLISVPLAALFALILFLCMRGLVAVNAIPMAEKEDTFVVDIRPEVPEEKRPARTITPVLDVQAPPPVERLDRNISTRPYENVVAIEGQLPRIDPPVITTAVSFTVSDRDAQPFIRMAGAYPPSALERGLEGHCLMRFDVTPDGTPTNIRALDCTSSVFATPSVRAVEQWRYKPKIAGGVPVARSGVETRVEYQLGN